jgi:hypothetical protein
MMSRSKDPKMDGVVVGTLELGVAAFFFTYPAAVSPPPVACSHLSELLHLLLHLCFFCPLFASGPPVPVFMRITQANTHPHAPPVGIALAELFQY